MTDLTTILDELERLRGSMHSDMVAVHGSETGDEMDRHYHSACSTRDEYEELLSRFAPALIAAGREAVAQRRRIALGYQPSNGLGMSEIAAVNGWHRNRIAAEQDIIDAMAATDAAVREVGRD
jgi:hypothetical protein